MGGANQRSRCGESLADRKLAPQASAQARLENGARQFVFVADRRRRGSAGRDGRGARNRIVPARRSGHGPQGRSIPAETGTLLSEYRIEAVLVAGVGPFLN